MAKPDRRRAGERTGLAGVKWRWPAPGGLAERHAGLYQLFMWCYISALGCHIGYFALLSMQPYPQPVVAQVVGTLLTVASVILHRRGHLQTALLLLVVPVSLKASWWEHQFGVGAGFEYYHILSIFFICIAPMARITRLLTSGGLLIFYLIAQSLPGPVYIGSYEFMATASIVNLVICVTFIGLVAIEMGWESERREKRYLLELRHDQLTGALSRLALREEGARMLQEDGLGVLMIDVDHFKTINDTHGHASGDDVLVELTRRLSHHLRGSDLLCRQGGEEFVALCPSNDRQGLRHAADRLLQSINGRAFVLNNGKLLRVTVSIGVAQGGPATAAESLLPELIRRADQAMYRAKRTGRNRVVTAWDMLDEPRSQTDAADIPATAQATAPMPSPASSSSEMRLCVEGSQRETRQQDTHGEGSSHVAGTGCYGYKRP
ncbi:GGDEF domain-containing protein [Cobetia sp. 5-11-6-3]|uniref:GGDEF domain-containing protein n=1 Tax=Cobetia sp. 5-11-6-3 TaxID=2737458 RepID=UPI001596D055|nr:GGDEF domain-containing protein [Cobetia sp. 5-11-6-3]